MRTIIRFSIENEKNSALRNRLATILESGNFVRQGKTATWEHRNIGNRKLGRILGEFWRAAAGHQGPGHVDHFWMYSDMVIKPFSN
jgi:hypothetical protein